jgi:hypothetical protein
LDTPETDAERCDVDTYAGDYMSNRTPDGQWVHFTAAQKIERQRNAAWKTLKEIRELFTADESFGATVEALFAQPLEEAEAEIARLQSLLTSR